MAAVWRTQSAFARILYGKTNQILNNATDSGTKVFASSQSNVRDYSSFSKSPFVEKIKEQYDFEVVKNPPEWKYVKQLLPFDTIPAFQRKESYPSGWQPPKEEALDHPFFVARTKNHLIPVYLIVTHRGMSKRTRVKRVEGDIWLMNNELKAYLKEKNRGYVETRVHELARFIEAKGDYVHEVTDWLLSKGF